MDIKETLGYILALSKEMLSLAEKGDWEALARVTQERTQRMHALENVEFTKQDAYDLLNQIKNVNDQIIVYGTQAREQTVSQLRTLQVGKKANHAYKG